MSDWICAIAMIILLIVGPLVPPLIGLYMMYRSLDGQEMPGENATKEIHAHWIHKQGYNGDWHTVCSNCGSDRYGHSDFDFCMDCGAKMDE